MTDMEQRTAAKAFASDWKGRGDEKQETQSFWMALLQKVYGVAEPDKYIQFELPVKLSHTSFIDGYIPATRVLIEQKGQEIDLRKGAHQSDGSVLTPFQQARRYAGYLPHDMNPRWIVVCNFQEFQIHDMNRPNDTPEIIRLCDLEKEYSRMSFLVNTGDEVLRREMEISIQAGELVGKLYDGFLKQYKDPTNPQTLKSLNMLCVRLVFCLYAEDAGIFGQHLMFHDYMKNKGVQNARKALRDLFHVLDQTMDQRDPYLADDDPLLAAFPYVNGGLFSDENIEIPPFTPELFDMLLARASEDFDWSEISPTIFGAVFESTLNPETRRSGGMHYTSIENIHKVIDPLFLDDLRSELSSIKAMPVMQTRKRSLEAFQEKLASLKFLDPACGSGNFLTETYLSLRRLENEVIEARYSSVTATGEHQLQIGFGLVDNPIRVSIRQFYGIEINDFAATVAKTALWIAESQMMKATADIIHMNLDFLPLKTYVNIVEGNALRIDWATVVPKAELSYIMGNPPFVGARLMSSEQKSDVLSVFGAKWKGVGELDYVSCWYKKSADLMIGTDIHTALVSTNSITQGEQVPILWKKLYENGVVIDFAYKTFRWDSEAKIKAHVHCVIIGFSSHESGTPKRLFANEQVSIVPNINFYLLNAENVFVESRKKPLCNVPEMVFGNTPIDDGNLIIEADELDAFIENEPLAQKYVHPLMGSREFINGLKRYCLWFVGVSPSEIKKMPNVMARINAVREMRENSNRDATRKLKDYPYLFGEIRQPTSGDYLIIPLTSSERRRYIPIGFVGSEVIATNLVQMLPNASLYHFGILTSNVSNSWMRAVCGRLKSDYRYTITNVYNTFPWPTPTDAQKAKIEQTAQEILDARALYPDCSLADLYDEVTMPPELRKAHQRNDRAVMEAYGFWGKLNTETDCVAALMAMYAEMTK